MSKVSVIGGGAWGTALASATSRAGSEVAIWAREEEVVTSINERHENTPFLATIPLPSSIKATNNLGEAIKADLILLVPPAQFMKATCDNLKKSGLDKSTPLVICSKGIEKNTLKLMSEVVSEILPNPISILTGPTFAAEVAKGLHTFITIASDDEGLRNKIEKSVCSETFKARFSDDIIGAQIGGAVKNVIAIACGIVDGKDLGENAKAALIVGGLREMEQLCEAKGGKLETLTGLCGLGDLILTCSSRQSRNNSLGYALGQGETLQEIMESRKSVAEGVASSESVTELAKKLGLTLPICEGVRKIINGEDINKVIEQVISSY